MAVYRILTIGSSLTKGTGGPDDWQKALAAQLQASYFPSDTVQVIDRGIGGAASDRMLNNLSEYLACDPSAIVFEDINSAHTAKNISTTMAQGYTETLFLGLRNTFPNIPICMMTGPNVRDPASAIQDEHKLYDMQRYLALDDTEPNRDKRATWLFDAAAYWWRVANSHFPDGLHFTDYAVNTYVIPRMRRFLGPRLQGAGLRAVTSPEPAPITEWEPLP